MNSKPGNSIKFIIHKLIQDNPEREGLLDTPRRYLKAMEELTWGTRQDEDTYLKEICTVFDGENYDEMILVKGIHFVSLCEHHMLPFTGTVDFGYLPGADNKIVGLSKLPRIVHFYAARLQVQERMTIQISNALQKLLPNVAGVGVRVKAEHTCMEIRGVKAHGTETITTSLLGCFKNSDTRSEFFSMVQ